MTRTLRLGLVILLMPLLIPTKSALAQCLGMVGVFRPKDICAETIVENLPAQGIASISALAFGPDDVLYFARPATRQVIRLAPNGPNAFQPMQVFAENLPEPPNGLTYDPVDQVWYVSGDSMIVRLRDANNDGTAEEQQIIVRDLPGGAGGWLGNLHVGPDRRLYVAKAVRCDDCNETDPRRGALLSFKLDGSDMQIVAKGLRDSYDFAWDASGKQILIVDNERPGLPGELNLITQSGQDFSAPHCQTCTDPIATFGVDSHPTGIIYYDGERFQNLKGSFLVALYGSWNSLSISGYELLSVRLGTDGTVHQDRFLPVTRRTTADSALGSTSFYPYHLTSIAVNSQGHIYLAVAEGSIYRLR
jgi:glucose/arabinose dehydrogenase